MEYQVDYSFNDVNTSVTVVIRSSLDLDDWRNRAYIMSAILDRIHAEGHSVERQASLGFSKDN